MMFNIVLQYVVCSVQYIIKHYMAHYMFNILPQFLIKHFTAEFCGTGFIKIPGPKICHSLVQLEQRGPLSSC